MDIKEFKEYIKKHGLNVLDHDDSDLNDIFKSEDGFILTCKKCGSTKVEVGGAFGCDYGEETGYCSDSTTFKCKECGNAKSISV